MGISVTLLKETFEQVLDLGGRIAYALEVIAGLRPAPSSCGETVTYGHLRQFVADQSGNRNRGQAGPLWDVLRGSALEACLVSHHLSPVRKGADLDVAALKVLVGSRHLSMDFIPGLGERRLDLLIRWVASL